MYTIDDLDETRDSQVQDQDDWNAMKDAVRNCNIDTFNARGV